MPGYGIDCSPNWDVNGGSLHGILTPGHAGRFESGPPRSYRLRDRPTRGTASAAVAPRFGDAGSRHPRCRPPSGAAGTAVHAQVPAGRPDVQPTEDWRRGVATAVLNAPFPALSLDRWLGDGKENTAATDR